MSNEVGIFLIISCACFVIADFIRRQRRDSIRGTHSILIFAMKNAPGSVRKNAVDCGAESALYAVAIETEVKELPWFLHLDKTNYRTYQGRGVLILYILPPFPAKINPKG